MNTQVMPSRQEQLNQVIEEALKDPIIREAMAMFRMGEQEYARAIAGTLNVTFTTNASSTSEDNLNDKLDRNDQ